MTGPGIFSYSTVPANNVTANTGINWDEGMSPAAVNNSARQNMTDMRNAFNDLIWFRYGKGDLDYSPVYVSGTSIKITGIDVTAVYHVGRRLKIVGSGTGTIYGTISATAFSTDTTVTIVFDSGSLTNETLVTYVSQIPMTGSPAPCTPSFSAYAASTQSISNSVFTKVTLATENFDTNANFASSRFTPTLAGYYQMNAVIRFADSVAITQAQAAFYKNGAEYRRGFYTGVVSNNGNITGSISDVIYCNGSSDYIELFGFIAGTSPSFDFASSVIGSMMSGSFLHP